MLLNSDYLMTIIPKIDGFGEKRERFFGKNAE